MATVPAADRRERRRQSDVERCPADAGPPCAPASVPPVPGESRLDSRPAPRVAYMSKVEATKVEATKVEATKVEATKVEATKRHATKGRSL